MKFEVDCQEFKKAVESALVVAPKKSSLAILECLKISTEDGNTISISATNNEQYVKLEIPATVLENGECFIHADDIRKVYGLSGYVIIEAGLGGFVVHNNKKKSAVKIMNFDSNDVPSYPSMKDSELFIETDGGNFVEILGALSIFTKNECMEILDGFHFDGEKNWIVTCDSYRFTVRNFDGFKACRKATVTSKVYSQLKKIVPKKGKSEIKVYVNDKYIMFSGDCFKLWSRLYKGTYPDISKLIFKPDFTFKVNPDEMQKVCKEYATAIRKNKIPMFLAYYSKDKTLKTGLISDSYSTFDEIESFEKGDLHEENDIIYGLSPVYIKESMTLFDLEVDCKGTYCQGNHMKTPIIFDNGTYLSLVLPININDNSVERFGNFTSAA